MHIDYVRGMNVMFLFSCKNIQSVYSNMPYQFQIIKYDRKTNPSNNDKA